MISTKNELDELIALAETQDYVALDTEFVWESTYYPNLGLIQLGWSKEDVYLIDAPAIDDLSAVGRLLSLPSCCKILHDAPQDLMLLARATKHLPVNIYDTRYAAGFASLPMTLSLNKLLEELLQIVLPKTETRTNWLARPLSDAQQEYALDDIRYLPELRFLLDERIGQTAKADWLKADFQDLEEQDFSLERNPETAYLRVKGAGRLSPQELCCLKEIAGWREETARRSNQPRGRILRDEALLKCATIAARKGSELEHLPVGVRSRFEGEILATLRKASQIPQSNWPDALKAGPVPRELKESVNQVLQAVRIKAEEEGFDPALLGNRKEFTALMQNEGKGRANLRLCLGWRADFLQPILRDLPPSDGN